MWFDGNAGVGCRSCGGWSSVVAGRAHNPKVVSSNLTPATISAIYGPDTGVRPFFLRWVTSPQSRSVIFPSSPGKFTGTQGRRLSTGSNLSPATRRDQEEFL